MCVTCYCCTFFSPAKQDAKSPPASYHRNRGALFALLVLSQALTQYLAGISNSSLSGCQNCRVLLSRNIISLSVAPVVLFCKPRVCGEKSSMSTAMGSWKGSPPRMRGKDRLRHPRNIQCWITPAYAGKRNLSGLANQSNGDHPRVCGEK